MKIKTVITIIGAAILGSAHAGTIAVDTTSGLNALVSGYGGLTLGWEFQVTDAKGVTVDGLGFWDHQSDGFVLSQTFPVGLWDASTGVLLRTSVITSASALKTSADPDGGWRINAVSPAFLPPGVYRIGVLMPVSGANQMIVDGATVQSAGEITLVRHLRQIGSATLAMPDLPMNSREDVNFGPTFTYVPGPLPLSSAVVAPSAYATTPGTIGVNTLLRNSGAPRTYQLQFSANVLGGLPAGAQIIELRFRQSQSGTTTFPSATVTWADYDVTLAQAANAVSNMSPYFLLNMVSPVLVKSGALSLGAGTFTAGSTPNDFGSLIVLDTPYVYQGGDLVMLFRHVGSDSTSTAYLDAVSSVTAGYGTNFRALSASTFTADTGISASANIVQIVFRYSLSQSSFCDGTNLVIVGTGGLPGGTYRLLTSTNLALPMAQWTPVVTNVFDAGNCFHHTNALKRDSRAQFFRFAIP